MRQAWHRCARCYRRRHVSHARARPHHPRQSHRRLHDRKMLAGGGSDRRPVDRIRRRRTQGEMTMVHHVSDHASTMRLTEGQYDVICEMLRPGYELAMLMLADYKAKQAAAAPAPAAPPAPAEAPVAP